MRGAFESKIGPVHAEDFKDTPRFPTDFSETPASYNRWDNFLAEGGRRKAVFYPRFMTADHECQFISATSLEIPFADPGGGALTLGADQFVCRGSTTNGPISIQNPFDDAFYAWERSSDGENWEPVPGADSGPAYQPPPFQETTYYRVALDDGACFFGDYTNVVKIEVIDQLEGGYLRAERDVICNGNSHPQMELRDFSGNVAWWEHSPDGRNWTAVDLQATSYAGAAELEDALRYRVRLEAPGCTSVYSESLEIRRVDEPAPRGGAAAADITEICAGRNFNLTASGFWNEVVGWEYKPQCSDKWIAKEVAPGVYEDVPNDWAPLPGAPADARAVVTYEAGYGAEACFRAVVISNAACGPAYSEPVTVYQKHPTECGAEPPGGECSGAEDLCLSEKAFISLTNFVGTVVRWEMRPDEDEQWTAIPHTGTTLETPELNDTISFRAVVLVQGNEHYSSVITINVVAEPSGGELDGDRAVCRGASPRELEVSGATGHFLTWQFSENAGETWREVEQEEEEDTPETYAPGALMQDTWFRVRTEHCEATYYSNVVKATVFDADATNPGRISTERGFVCTGGENNFVLQNYVGEVLKWQLLDEEENELDTLPGAADSVTVENIAQSFYLRALVQNNVCEAQWTQAVFTNVAPELEYSFMYRNENPAQVCAGAEVPLVVSYHNVIPQEILTMPDTAQNWTSVWNAETGGPLEEFRTPPVRHKTRFAFVVAPENNPACPNDTTETLLLEPDDFTTDPGTIEGVATVCAGSEVTLRHVSDFPFTEEERRWTYSTSGGQSWRDARVNKETITLTLRNANSQVMVYVALRRPGCEELRTDTFSIQVAEVTEDPGVRQTDIHVPDAVCGWKDAELSVALPDDVTEFVWQYRAEGTDGWQELAGAEREVELRQSENMIVRIRFEPEPCRYVYSQEERVIFVPNSNRSDVSGPDFFCEGEAATFMLDNVGGEVLEWHLKRDCEQLYRKIPADGPSLRLSDIPAGAYCLSAFTVAESCGFTETSAYSFAVGAQPSAGTASAVVPDDCAAETASVKLENHDGLLLEWQIRPEGTVVWTSANVGVQPEIEVPFRETGFDLRAVVFGEGNCGGEMYSNEVRIERNVVSGFLSAEADTYCIDAPETEIRLQLEDHEGTILRWERSEDGGQNWQELPLTDDVYVVSGLERTARFRVAVACGDATQFSNAVEIRARLCNESCLPPSNLYVEAGATQAAVSWPPAPFATDYELQWRTKDAPEWSPSAIQTPEAAEYIIEGLEPETFYDVRVRAHCADVVSGWVETEFETGILSSAAQLVGQDGPRASIYPNPGGGDFTLALTGAAPGAAEIVLRDITGKVVWKANAAVNPAAPEIPVATELASGVYVLEFRQAGTILRANVQIVR